jgi:uncharacterized protein involved in exopolysaccharide biosynthesis
MEEEIDIRGQILAVLRSWKLILALAVLAAAAAAVYAWTLPDEYEAEALVSLTPGRVTFDLESVSQGGSMPVAAYVELAESSPVAQAILDAAGPEGLGTIQSVGALRSRLSAQASNAAPLLRLEVTDTDPDRAARIANLWAQAFTELAGQLYGQDQANLALYEEGLAEAEAALDVANADLAAFEATNRISILQAQLSNQQNSLSDYSSRAREAELLSQDLQDLLVRLESLPTSAPAALTDDLALLTLTNRVYGGQSTGPSSDTRVQVQVSGDTPLTNGTVADQRQLAEDLLAALATRQDALNEQLMTVEPSILDLQGQLAAARAEEQRLVSAHDLAVELFASRSLQVKEADLAVRQTANVAQVASAANAPNFATGPQRATYVLLGGALGVALAVVLALAREFLRPAAVRAGGAPTPATARARTR